MCLNFMFNMIGSMVKWSYFSSLLLFIRHNEVHKKGPDDICAFFDVKGEPLWCQYMYLLNGTEN